MCCNIFQYAGYVKNELQTLFTKTINWDSCRGYYGDTRVTQICTWNSQGFGQCGVSFIKETKIYAYFAAINTDHGKNN